MFVHQNQLEHLLEPSAYFSHAQYEREGTRLFGPAWHVVAARGELPRPGDFKTLEVLGRPLVVRNFDGEWRAFLNVCAHRHALLTHRERGRCDRLKCQYHGWEYQADGSTAYIPEARIFRPWDRETARLTAVRLAVCGDLVFAALDAEAPPLEDFLGPFHESCAAWFDSAFRFAESWANVAPANWKVLTENSLESYHVPVVHPTSFAVAPPEENCRHEWTERGSTFRAAEALSWRGRGQALLARSLGLPVTNVYTHHLTYPHLQFVNTDLVRLAIQILPLSPTTCEQRVWVFAPRGVRGNPWARLVRAALRRVTAMETRRILAEDAAIFRAVQRGLEASPYRGVIGTREERIYAFQRHVLQTCGGVSGGACETCPAAPAVSEA